MRDGLKRYIDDILELYFQVEHINREFNTTSNYVYRDLQHNYNLGLHECIEVWMYVEQFTNTSLHESGNHIEIVITH